MSEQQTKTNLPIAMDQTGILRPSNLDEAWRLASAYAQSGILPERFKGNPSMVLAAMQMGIELGLKPITALRQIAVVKGTPTVYGDLPLAMAYSGGKLEYIKEAYFDSNGVEISMANKNLASPVFGAVCIVKRKGDPEPRETSFTMQEANDAGLLKPSRTGQPGAWQLYPKIMLKYRARTQALKDKFPDALNGISVAEYDHNLHQSDVETITIAKQDVGDISVNKSILDKIKEKSELDTVDVETMEMNEEANAE